MRSMAPQSSTHEAGNPRLRQASVMGSTDVDELLQGLQKIKSQAIGKSFQSLANEQILPRYY
jgi:hypothetical protein